MRHRLITARSRRQKPCRPAQPAIQGITLSDGEPKPSIAQLSGQTGESAEVQRTVELYAGEYKDSRSYGDNPNCPDNWCSIIIYNVTASSFDFFIQQYQPEKQSSVVVFNPHRAIFIDDGQRAAYYGKNMTCSFPLRILQISLSAALKPQTDASIPTIPFPGMNFHNQTPKGLSENR